MKKQAGDFMDMNAGFDDSFGKNISEWVVQHPELAALYGMAGGVVLGLVGVSRILIGLRLLSSVPAWSETIMNAVERATSGKRDRFAGSVSETHH